MKEQNITVALRVRPLNPREVRSGATPIAKVADGNLVALADPSNKEYLRAKRSHESKYMFDVAFKQPSIQREVYEQTAQGLISKVINGYNATVFAYGATGAGKTYTMLGRAGEPGIMALTLNDLFTKMKQNKDTKLYHVTMAYLEIYNETVRNLLGPSSGGILDVREDAHGATIVSGLMEVEVKDTEEVMALLTRGNLRRTCEPTAVNRTSSRSHAILKVTVEQQSRVMNICQKIRTGVLFMVDLAGSERAANTKNRGQRMKEGAHINRSLLALANCINTLCSGGQYVNYRDSKLTRLLKDALSGNCFTVMIAHISPASTCYEESKNTLKYADRVKHLKTKVCRNIVEVDRHVAEYVMCMRSMKCRIGELEKQLNCRDKEGEILCSELKTLLSREKMIREEMVSLEHQLLLIALDRQKQTAIIQRSGGLSTPSPLPASSLSPLPTTLEDTGQTSLLFERSSNWFADPSHMIEPTQSMDDHMTTMETADNNHMTDPNPMDESHLTTSDSHMTTTQDTHNDHMTTADSSYDNHMTSDDHLITSSDSDHQPNVMTGEEAEEVSTARVELVGLQMKRRRVEARHRRLGRKLMEIKTEKSQLQKRLSMGVSGVYPHQMELCTVLQLCSDLEEDGRKRDLAGARTSLQLRRSDTALDGLLDINHQLVTALLQYRELLEERVDCQSQCSLPPLQPLLSHTSSLTRQVERERRLPVAGRALQLPTFSAYSSRLCATDSTTFAGSKSNLLVEDVTDGEGEEEDEDWKVSTVQSPSDIQLPMIQSSFQQDSSLSLPQFSSSLSLPPISYTTSLITNHTTTAHTTHNTVFPNSSMPAVVHQTNHHLANNKFFNRRPSKQSLLPASPSNTQCDISTAADTTMISITAVESTAIGTDAVDSAQINNATVQTPKRTSAKAIFSKVTPRISISSSSSNKRKYMCKSERIEEDEDKFPTSNRDILTNISSIDVEMVSTVPRLNESTTSTKQNTSDTVHRPLQPSPTKSVPNVVTATAKPAGVRVGAQGGTKKEGKELTLQSVSQLSLSRSTPLGKRRAGPGGRVGKRFRSRQSIPLVRTTEQKTKRETLAINNKPRNSMPALTKKKARERETLVPAKVVAGNHLDKMGSPYLKPTSKYKSETKRVVSKTTNSTHPVTKFKSPYHVPMARTNRIKK